jgi:hypothetical protein
VNSFSNNFGWQASRFAGHAGTRLGVRHRLGEGPDEATLASDYRIRADAALQNFDILLGRTSEIDNLDARRALLGWVSTPDAPGTPAERYRVVAEDLSRGAPFSDVAQKRLGDLETMNAMFESKVKQAEQAYATKAEPAPAGATSKPGGGLTTTGIVLGAGALFGLLVVPLVWGE